MNNTTKNYQLNQLHFTDYQPQYYIFLDENLFLCYLNDAQRGLDYLQTSIVGDIKIIIPKYIQEKLKKSDSVFYSELIKSEIVELYNEDGDLIECAEKFRHDEFPKKIVISNNIDLIYRALQNKYLDISLPLNCEFKILNSAMFQAIDAHIKEEALTNDIAKIIFINLFLSYYPEQVFKYSQELSNKNDIQGEYHLAICYQLGVGCNKNEKIAIEHFKKASALNDCKAELQLGLIEYSKSKFSKKAIDWFSKSANHGNDIAQYYIALNYKQNNDYENAIKYYTLSANQGNIKSIYSLALLYQEGKHCEQKLEEALNLAKIGANIGDSNCQFLLGASYYLGKGCEIDGTRAFNLLTKSAEQNNIFAQYYLGLCYLKGIGCEKNNNLATIYFVKSAKNGCPQAIKKCQTMNLTHLLK